MSDQTAEQTGAVARQLYDRKELLNLGSFAEALRLMEARTEVAAADEELGDGFQLLDDKDRLIGIPLIVMEWSFNDGDFGEFVSARIVASFGGDAFGRYIINDGSTGFYRQMREFTDDRIERAKVGDFQSDPYAGLVVRKGLRKSTYMTEVDGKPTQATTYYINTSA